MEEPHDDVLDPQGSIGTLGEHHNEESHTEIGNAESNSETTKNSANESNDINDNNNDKNDTDTNNNDTDTNTDTNKTSDVDDLNSRKRPFSPDSIYYETVKKRIPPSQMDKFWDYLDSTTISSLTKIMDIGIVKSLERLSNVNKSKVAEKYLLKSWILDDPRSFVTRLNSTTLPKPHTMHSTSSKNDENVDILNYDHLNHRKKWLETYLSAEIKQLEDLKKYHERLNDNYQADNNYLRDLEKTIDANKSKMAKERSKRENYSLVRANTTEKVNVIEETPFKLEDNDEFSSTLNDINNNLINLQKKSQNLHKLNDSLTSFLNNVDYNE